MEQDNFDDGCGLKSFVVWNDAKIKPREDDMDWYVGPYYLCKFRQKLRDNTLGGCKFAVCRYDFSSEEFESINHVHPDGGIKYELVGWAQFNG